MAVVMGPIAVHWQGILARSGSGADGDEDRAVATIEDHLRGSYERVAAGLDLRAGRTAGEGADGGR